jgi:hypothetical protein
VRRQGLLLLAVVLGCASSKPAPRPATDAELAYEDQTDDATREAIRNGKTSAPGTETRPLDARYPELALLKPTTQGTVMTVIQVTEVGPRGGPYRPAAMIFSSDKDSPYLQERPRQSRVLKPMDPARMDKLLADLRAAGLDALPAEAADLDARITAERQFILIRDGKRTDVKKSVARFIEALRKTGELTSVSGSGTWRRTASSGRTSSTGSTGSRGRSSEAAAG